MANIKKAVFNILNYNKRYSGVVQNSYVLDLFCGTGSVGLEALSNGAKHIFMLDQDTRTVSLNSLRFKESVTIIRGDGKNPPITDKACDLIFIDPPYKEDDYEMILDNLARSGWVKQGSIIILEVSAKKRLHNFDKYELLDERKYSRVKILILRFMSYDLNKLREFILNKFDDAEVSVRDMAGDGNHLFMIVASRHFKDKSILEQHKMVYSALGNKVGNDFHALKLKTTVKE